MAVTHKNRVQMTVSGTPGTGTITLNAASSGYQSFASAYGADATVDVLITDGTAWEVARECAYTHSGTTLTRGTLEASSTGAAISLTSSALVSVVATAARGQAWDAAALTHATGGDAATTMAVNTLYVVDMSAWATASRTYTLPATASAGDRVGIVITGGNATYKLSITAAAGDTLDGVSGGTEWSGLYNTSEMVVFRCVAASATWVCEFEKWKDNPVNVVANGTTTQTMTRNVNTKATSVLATESADADGLWDATAKTFTARRPGIYTFHSAIQMASIVDTKGTQITLYKNGAAFIGSAYCTVSGTSSPVNQVTASMRLASGDTVELYSYHEDAATNRATSAVASNNYITAVRVAA